MAKLLWTPTDEIIQNANITKFINFVNSSFNLKLSNYNDLYNWSINSTSLFWEAIWKFTKILHSSSYDTIVENLDRFPPETKWFKGSKLNFAENLLRYKDDQTAILFKNEVNQSIKITYSELYEKVSQLSSSLRKIGLKAGERAVGYMPNIPETVITMLSTTSLGAVWASCGAELGEIAALDRLGQIKPKVLFTVDAYLYKEKEFNQLEKVKRLIEGIPSLEKIIVIPYINKNPNLSFSDKLVLYDDFLDDQAKETNFEQMNFSDPVYIMFSSGTTGKPKCMVQSIGGVLINHLKELVLHTDLKRNDKLMYITSPSWMMWNWLISGLACGATIVLFDGNPLHPDWRTMFKLIESEKITIFGCSASYLHFLKNENTRPGKEFNLESLREISQTGSSLSEEGFNFVYNEIRSELHFNSISGGTDINGCFAAGVPILPVYNGELQARALGMKVFAYDDKGKPIYDEQGELICELASPSMPIYFWNDMNNQKYDHAYFDFFKDKKVWRHGDYILIHKDTGGVTFYGRSDAVLKPSGVRIGTSEIYNIVEEFPEISDSLAIGQTWKNDQRILLFVKLAPGYELDETLKSKIINALKIKASPRHVPQMILTAPDIPYTFSGKKVESSITNIIHNRPITNKGALRNPECLEYYEKIKEKLV